MKKLWGSRFQEEMAQEAREFSFSLLVDCELLPAEIRVSQAHAAMLARTRLISRAEGARLRRGLEAVHRELRGADFAKLAPDFEDIHTLIQARLEAKVGSVAKKLHTGRSRNDLVATSTRLYLKEKLAGLRGGIRECQQALLSLAERHPQAAIPGYTHLQRAQTVLVAHHLLAYVEMLARDEDRLKRAAERMDECPLGSGAIAGSSLALDRLSVAKELGFSRITANSVDAVSDRDFVLDALSAIAILFVHLSRLAEDFILWNSSEFGFAACPDSHATGSSLMPQKKNPDMLELTRGRAGVVFGHLVSMLTVMKGLPLAYNRDLQEDKKAVFESLAVASRALAVLAGLIRKMRIREARCSEAVSDSLLYATDCVEYLILQGMPFQDAHELVGKMVSHSLAVERPMKEWSFKEFKRFSPLIGREIYDCFNPRKSLHRKRTSGSTNPDLVAKQIKIWKKKTGTWH